VVPREGSGLPVSAVPPRSRDGPQRDVLAHRFFPRPTSAPPVSLLHGPHAGRMLLRRYVPPWQPGMMRFTVSGRGGFFHQSSGASVMTIGVSGLNSSTPQR